ncbi:hypothetical protein [Prescottella agglutinans]|uniref:Uncharacterized protein n=1 Tax=Prescottella agglutinans TaxID=1644129 RepID=A0ABT6MJ24_9NOCA|nr:hypothetical protein [Prescottella agglutinans]MDH6284295.1 hypothetical protein [Prescottella agglutinans]
MKHTLNMYRGRLSRDAVVAAPSVNTAASETVRTLAFFGGCFFGLVPALSGMLGVAAGINNDPDVLLLPATMMVVIGLAVMGAAVGAHRLTRARERKHGVLIAADIEAAPQTLSLPLMDALTAADTIRESRAYQEKWLADVNVDAALWDLAQHVMTGTEIERALDGAGEGTDAATLAEGTAARDACTEHVAAAAARLADLASRVEAFDLELGEPDRLAKLEEARARRERIEAQHRARLATAAADVAAIVPAVDETTDRIAGQLDAYTDRVAMTAKTLV